MTPVLPRSTNKWSIKNHNIIWWVVIYSIDSDAVESTVSDINKSPILQGRFPECWKFHRGDYLNLPLSIAFQGLLWSSPQSRQSCFSRRRAPVEISLTQMGLAWEQTKFSGLSHKSMTPFPVMLVGATGCPEYRMMEPRLISPCGYKGGLYLLCQHWRLRVCVLVSYPLVLKVPPSGRGTEGDGDLSVCMSEDWKIFSCGASPGAQGYYFASFWPLPSEAEWHNLCSGCPRSSLIMRQILSRRKHCSSKPDYDVPSWRCRKKRTPESIRIIEIPLATCRSAHTHKYTH